MGGSLEGPGGAPGRSSGGHFGTISGEHAPRTKKTRKSCFFRSPQGLFSKTCARLLGPCFKSEPAKLKYKKSLKFIIIYNGFRMCAMCARSAEARPCEEEAARNRTPKQCEIRIEKRTKKTSKSYIFWYAEGVFSKTFSRARGPFV